MMTVHGLASDDPAERKDPTIHGLLAELRSSMITAQMAIDNIRCILPYLEFRVGELARVASNEPTAAKDSIKEANWQWAPAPLMPDIPGPTVEEKIDTILDLVRRMV